MQKAPEAAKVAMALTAWLKFSKRKKREVYSSELRSQSL